MAIPALNRVQIQKKVSNNCKKRQTLGYRHNFCSLGLIPFIPDITSLFTFCRSSFATINFFCRVFILSAINPVNGIIHASPAPGSKTGQQETYVEQHLCSTHRRPSLSCTRDRADPTFSRHRRCATRTYPMKLSPDTVSDAKDTAPPVAPGRRVPGWCTATVQGCAGTQQNNPRGSWGPVPARGRKLRGPPARRSTTARGGAA